MTHQIQILLNGEGLGNLKVTDADFEKADIKSIEEIQVLQLAELCAKLPSLKKAQARKLLKRSKVLFASQLKQTTEDEQTAASKNIITRKIADSTTITRTLKANEISEPIGSSSNSATKNEVKTSIDTGHIFDKGNFPIVVKTLVSGITLLQQLMILPSDTVAVVRKRIDFALALSKGREDIGVCSDGRIIRVFAEQNEGSELGPDIVMKQYCLLSTSESSLTFFVAGPKIESIDLQGFATFNGKFQIASDLHLEIPLTWKTIGSTLKKAEGCEVLCLLGDIATLKKINPFEQLLDYCCSHWKIVLFVFGNHELYNFKPKSKIGTVQRAWHNRLFSKYSNLHVLDRRSVRIGHVIFAGATLWTHVSAEAAKYVGDKKKGLTDYKVVKVWDESKGKATRLQPVHTNAWYLKDLDFLEQAVLWDCKWIDTNMPDSVVVLTHHPPHKQMHGDHQAKIEGVSEQERHAISTCFYNVDCDHLMQRHVPFWCFGHTHGNETSFRRDYCQQTW